MTENKTSQLMNLPMCLLCSSSKRSKLFEIKNSTVYECQSCRLRYLDPCLSPQAMASAYESNESLVELHDFHEGYYDYGDIHENSKTRQDFVRGLDLSLKNIPDKDSKSILDVGFGNGYFLAIAKNLGWQIAGIDPSQKNLECAKEKYGLDLQCGFLEGDIPDGERFDAISFWDVIEHLPDPKAALQKCLKLLKPGGVILVGVPHDKSLLMRVASLLYHLSGGGFNFGVNKLYFLEHVAYYDLTTLTKLFEDQGYSLKESFYSNTDLKKYKLPLWEKLLAGTFLTLGRLFGGQNRLVAVFQRSF